jgi:hypothetical protein
MQTVEILLGGTRYICGVCGLMSPDINEILAHEIGRKFLEEPDILIGQDVDIYRTVYSDGGRPTGITSATERWTVSNLWYSQGSENLCGSAQARQHQLCIELMQYLDAEKRGKGSESMTYHDFCLWRRGDRAELERAGLIRPAAECLTRRQKFLRAIGLG